MFKLNQHIPFDLFGTSWIIKFVKKTQSKKDGHWIFGHSNIMKKTVKVSINDDKGKPLDDETIQITALHELVHSILTTGQFLEETRDEPMVEWIARSIRALYKQGVIQQIMAENTLRNESRINTNLINAKRINKYGEEFKQG